MKANRSYIAALAAAALAAGCAQPDRSRNLADARVPGRVIAQQVCANCHGAGGNSVSPNFPALAGQSHAYLAAQLRAFRNRTRRDPQAVAYMWGLARGLTDEQVDELAAYYEAQPRRTDAAVPMHGDVESGRAIYVRGDGSKAAACVTCHGAAGEGSAIAPRLAGQHAAYVERQLRIYQTSNDRPDGAVMKLACAGMTAEEIRAVAVFIEALPRERPG